MGQAMLTFRLREALGDDADGLVEVTSAGTYGLVGDPIEPKALTMLDELGIPAPPFESSALVRAVLEQTDLVLTATREHRAASVSMLPRASRRTFTMREFARLVEAVDPSQVEDGDPVSRARALVDAAAGQRGYVRPAAPDHDDVADPYRRPVEAFRVAAQEIDAATRVIADRIAAVVQPAA